MAPDADADDLRRAYLRLAFAYHPDRLATASPAEREAAEARMQEVTQAWAVLGDDGSRLEYDRALTAAGASSTVDDPFAHLLRRQRAVGEVDEDDDAALGAQPPSWVRMLPAAVVVAVLGLIFVFSAYAGGPGGHDDEPEGVATTEEVPIGTCVTLPPGGGLTEVECGTRSDGTVAVIVDWPEPCPVPLVAVPVAERRESLCLRN